MFWEVFLECPQCNKRHVQVQLAFNPEGKASLSSDCCGRHIGLDLSWEDAVAGAIRQEEAYLLQSKAGRKQLEKSWAKEN